MSSCVVSLESAPGLDGLILHECSMRPSGHFAAIFLLVAASFQRGM
jgi:hypothetical protein